MKTQNMKKHLVNIQIVLAFIAFALFLFKSLIWRYNSAEYLITCILFIIPFLSALIFLLLSLHNNPRHLIQLSLLAFFSGMIISMFDLSHFHMMPTLVDMAGENYYYVILAVMLVLGFIILNACYISRYVYSVILVSISSLAFFLSLSDFLLLEYMQAVDMLSYAFLFMSLTLYAPRLNDDNEYDPKIYKLFLNDDEKQNCDFDVIVNAITDYALSLDEFYKFKNAYEFYYAVKNEEYDKIKALNIYGKKAIIEIFNNWLVFEKYFAGDEDDILFFRICKYLSSDKISEEDFYKTFLNFVIISRYGVNCFGCADIYLKSDKPWNRLSNLYNNGFTINNTEFTSMESFLQGIKFKNVNKQAKVFKMTGKDAKRAGKHHNFWKITGNLYYKGVRLKRNSEDYQLILDNLYYTLYEQNSEFRQALVETGLMSLEHSIGKTSKHKTILTKEEYLTRLNFLKDMEFDKYYLNK